MGISAVNMKAVVDAAGLAGGEVAEALRRAGLDPAVLAAPRNRITWDEMQRLFHALADVMGREEFLASGERFVAAIPHFIPFGRSFRHPEPLLRFLFEVMVSAAYPMIECVLTVEDPLTFDLHFTLDGRYETDALLWEVFARSSTSSSLYFGLPVARVSLRHSSHEATIRLHWPDTAPDDSETAAASPHDFDGARVVLEALGLDTIRLLSATYEQQTQLEAQLSRVQGLVERLVAELPEPAFLVGAGGTFRPANRPGSAELARRGDALAGELAAATSDDPHFSVLALLGDHRLVVCKAPIALPPSAEMRAERALARAEELAKEWALTRRQTEVLAELANGRSNKEIAAVLDIAEGTVQLHVSQVLKKAGRASRAEIVAVFWSDPASGRDAAKE